MTQNEQIAHINKIIDMLKAERDTPEKTSIKLDMTTWHCPNPCSTILCIGGHSDYITSVLEGAGQFKFGSKGEVANRFGLSLDDFCDLCYNDRKTIRSLSAIHQQTCPHTTAIRALEYVRDNGTFPGWAQFMDAAQ